MSIQTVLVGIDGTNLLRKQQKDHERMAVNRAALVFTSLLLRVCYYESVL